MTSTWGIIEALVVPLERGGRVGAGAVLIDKGTLRWEVDV